MDKENGHLARGLRTARKMFDEQKPSHGFVLEAGSYRGLCIYHRVPIRVICANLWHHLRGSCGTAGAGLGRISQELERD